MRLDNEWGFERKAKESLLFFSMKHRCFSLNNTLLVPVKDDYPIRAYSLLRREELYANLRKLSEQERSYSIISCIEHNDYIWNQIVVGYSKLNGLVSEANLNESIEVFNKVCKWYGDANELSIRICSLGIIQSEINDVCEAMKKHDAWRNSVALKEEDFGKAVFNFLEFVVKNSRFGINSKQFMEFLSLEELKGLLNGKLNDYDVEGLVKLREIQGFVYSSVMGVIDDKKEIDDIRNYLLNLMNADKIVDDKLTGCVAYSSGGKVIGEVVIIKDKSELEAKGGLVDGKVLVAIQTTPHYTPYLSRVKAFITDTGGTTCHGAIIARELMVPCIVGVGNATDVFNDGDLVEVDSVNGIVKRVS